MLEARFAVQTHEGTLKYSFKGRVPPSAVDMKFSSVQFIYETIHAVASRISRHVIGMLNGLAKWDAKISAVSSNHHKPSRHDKKTWRNTHHRTHKNTKHRIFNSHLERVRRRCVAVTKFDPSPPTLLTIPLWVIGCILTLFYNTINKKCTQ